MLSAWMLTSILYPLLAPGCHRIGKGKFMRTRYLALPLLFIATALLVPLSLAQVPVFEFDKAKSTIGFNVKASVAIVGKFDKWDATMTFTSADVKTGVLDIKAHAASVNTGSGMKDGKLKGKDFFDAETNPFITFHSTKIVQTGPNTLDYVGDFTI